MYKVKVKLLLGSFQLRNALFLILLTLLPASFEAPLTILRPPLPTLQISFFHLKLIHSTYIPPHRQLPPPPLLTRTVPLLSRFAHCRYHIITFITASRFQLRNCPLSERGASLGLLVPPSANPQLLRHNILEGSVVTLVYLRLYDNIAIVVHSLLQITNPETAIPVVDLPRPTAALSSAHYIGRLHPSIFIRELAQPPLLQVESVGIVGMVEVAGWRYLGGGRYPRHWGLLLTVVLELGRVLVLVIVGIGVYDGVCLVKVVGRLPANTVCMVREGPDTLVTGLCSTPNHKFKQICLLHTPWIIKLMLANHSPQHPLSEQLIKDIVLSEYKVKNIYFMLSVACKTTQKYFMEGKDKYGFQEDIWIM